MDPLTIVGVAFFIFIIARALSSQGWFSGLTQESIQPLVVSASAPDQIQETAIPEQAAVANTPHIQDTPWFIPLESSKENSEQSLEMDPDALAWPYASYVLTQGPHGMSYGHMAIDLTGGKGSAILSPINGEVTELFVDQYGNPTLIIENSHYKILMLHGVYTVQVGERVSIGQPVGKESNIGYTLDAQGRPCAGRDCGYHTHLNIYDKQIGSNVNPLDVLPR